MVWNDNVAICRPSAAIDDAMSKPLVGDQHRTLREGHVDTKPGEFEELICPGTCGIDDVGSLNGVFLALEEIFYLRPLLYLRPK